MDCAARETPHLITILNTVAHCHWAAHSIQSAVGVLTVNCKIYFEITNDVNVSFVRRQSIPFSHTVTLAAFRIWRPARKAKNDERWTIMASEKECVRLRAASLSLSLKRNKEKPNRKRAHKRELLLRKRNPIYLVNLTAIRAHTLITNSFVSQQANMHILWRIKWLFSAPNQLALKFSPWHFHWFFYVALDTNQSSKIWWNFDATSGGGAIAKYRIVS